MKGRGAQLNAKNPFLTREVVKEHVEGIDDFEESLPNTEVFYDTPKKILNKVSSPDIGLCYSLNTYQGCEHGCIYCYARTAHEYWGFSAGLDFESKIIVKQHAPELLRKEFSKKGYVPLSVMLSGNTDCYQPLERRLKITRKILEVFLEFRHPVSIITKNSLILRDLDILGEMARRNLVHVNISLTCLNEELRRLLEPRTASGKKRLQTIRTLSEAGVPVRAMIAPVIPGLNDTEIPGLLEAAVEHGASDAAYTIVRLNGSIAVIFEDWLRKSFPDRAEKVLNLIASCHGGKLSDNRYGLRMRGEGNIASMIAKLFRTVKSKYFEGRNMPFYDFSQFSRTPGNTQMALFS